MWLHFPRSAIPIPIVIHSPKNDYHLFATFVEPNMIEKIPTPTPYFPRIHRYLRHLVVSW